MTRQRRTGMERRKVRLSKFKFERQIIPVFSHYTSLPSSKSSFYCNLNFFILFESVQRLDNLGIPPFKLYSRQRRLDGFWTPRRKSFGVCEMISRFFCFFVFLFFFSFRQRCGHEKKSVGRQLFRLPFPLTLPKPKWLFLQIDVTKLS